MRPSEAKDRARAIRLSNKELALLSGLDENTVSRAFNGNGGLISTADRLAAAVEAEERRLLAHLLALHPDMAAGAVDPAQEAAE